MTDANTKVGDYPKVDAGIGEHRLFSVAMLISGVRCTLAYIVLPFLIPLLGLAPSVGPWLGMSIGVVAIVANVFSIRRFLKSNHRWRKPVIALNVAVIGLLLVLLIQDVTKVAG